MGDIAKIRKSLSGQGATAAAVQECLDEWIGAVNAHNMDETTALYAPDAVLLATFNPAILTTPGQRKNYFVNFLARKNLTASIGECYIEVLGGDTGAANGLYTFSFIDDAGAPQTIHARFSFIFVKQPEGDWLITAHHSSVQPPKNP